MLFLGDHAYGAAAQVTEATEQALTVELAVSIEYRRKVVFVTD